MCLLSKNTVAAYMYVMHHWSNLAFQVNSGAKLLRVVRNDLADVVLVCEAKKKQTNYLRTLISDLAKGEHLQSLVECLPYWLGVQWWSTFFPQLNFVGVDANIVVESDALIVYFYYVFPLLCMHIILCMFISLCFCRHYSAQLASLHCSSWFDRHPVGHRL